MASESQTPVQPEQPDKKSPKEAVARKPHSLETWIADHEKQHGRMANKVKEVFRARAIGRQDYDTVWQELWR